MQSLSPNHCTEDLNGSNLVVLETTCSYDSDFQCLPEVQFIALFWKDDDIHTNLGVY